MKTRNILCAFLTLIAVGCVKENEMPSGDKTPAGGNTITVNMPELTRTAIGDETQTGVSLVWSKGDEIAVIEGKGTETQKHSVYRLVGEGGTASGTFEYVSGDASAEVITDVVFPASAVENNYAVPTAQTYVEGSFDADAMVMSWTRASEDEGITLKHEAAVLMVRLTGVEAQKVASIDVECGGNTYTLTCDNPVALSSEGKEFYIAVPGSISSLDYTVKVNSSYGTTMTKNINHTLNAGKIGRLPLTPLTPIHGLKKGDYFGGGFVIKVDDEANLVKIVSKDEAKLAWAVEAHKTTLAGVTDNNPEGDINTAILVQNGIEYYPAAEWCINHGEGWYMPSRTEISTIVNGLGLEADWESANARIQEYGGDPFVKARYLTCTEHTEGARVWTNSIPSKDQTSVDNPKATARYVRAVKKIALTGGETADPKPIKETFNITPAADAFYSNASSNYYRGTLDNLYIYYATGGDLRRAAYFKLDISSIDVTALTSATLNLTVYSSKCDFYDFTELKYNAYKVSNEWEEIDYTSTLGKKKGVWTTSSTQVSSTTISPTAEKLVFDITDCVRSSLENNESVISICIQSPNTNYKAAVKDADGNTIEASKSAKLYVYSKESKVEGTQPYLQVTSTK